MTRNDRITIFALVCLAAAVQTVVIARTAVPALDSVRFVRHAQTIERQGILAAVRSDSEQPLFSMWLAAVHAGLSSVGVDDPAAWAYAAQVAAGVPLALAVIPVFLLARRLVGSAAARVGSLFFCVLPEIARLGGEGISDSLHLLLAATAIWLVVEALRRPEVADRWACLLWGLAGLVAGTAALARAEVLVLPVAVVASLCLLFPKQVRPHQGSVHVTQLLARGMAAAWRNVAVPSGCMILGLGLVLIPYILLAGATTPRAAAARVMGWAKPAPTRDAGPLRAELEPWNTSPEAFAVREPGTNVRRRGLGGGLAQFGAELADAFGYGVGLLALVGLWLRRRAITPAERFAQVFAALFCLAVLRFTVVEGYLGARHFALLVVVGTGAIGVGAWELGQLVARWPRRAEPRRGWAWSVVVSAAVVCVVAACQPVHAPRAAYRQAGQWLARASDPAGAVLDTRGWTELYSARPTYQYDRAQEALANPRLAYVVVREEELGRASLRSRTLTGLLATAAEPVARFSVPPDEGASLVVYRWRPRPTLQDGG